MSKRRAFLTVCFCVALSLCGIAAQNTSVLTDNETIRYSLTYNWKFVWIKAGTATLQTKKTAFDGQEAYSVSLMANTTKQADKIYKVRDTLMTIVTPQIEPLYFKKSCTEGKDIYQEETFFSKNGDKYLAQMSKNYSDGSVKRAEQESAEPIFDLISLMQYVRSIDTNSLQPGSVMVYSLVNNRSLDRVPLKYAGRQKVESGSGKVYDCQVFSISKPNKKGGEEEILRFYTEDSPRHLPIQIDMFMKIGVAKAILQ